MTVGGIVVVFSSL